MIVFRIIAALPRFVLPSLAGLLAVLASVFARKDSKIVKQNVQRVYNLPVGSEFADSFVRQVFQAQALLFLETIRYVFRPSEVRIDGIEDAKKILANVAEQTGEQRLMELFVARRLSIDPPAHLLDRLGELAMDIGPFPQLAR